MTLADLLDQFGTSWIDIRRLRGGQTATDKPLVIGRNYVPPLGGLSVIDEDRVAGPEHRHALEAAGYRPQRVSPAPSTAALTSMGSLRVGNMVAVLVVLLAVALALVALRAR